MTEVDGAAPDHRCRNRAWALANELQTAAASPDPEAVLLARGVRRTDRATGQRAAILPDPVDDWLTGWWATRSATRAVVAQLNARLKADVLPFALRTAGLSVRERLAVDVNTADFQRLLGPGGLIDAFTNTHLLQYVDTTVRPWQWRADFGLPAASLQPFGAGAVDRDAPFLGGVRSWPSRWSRRTCRPMRHG